MSALTLEELRAEFQRFTDLALKPELALIKAEIVQELKSELRVSNAASTKGSGLKKPLETAASARTMTMESGTKAPSKEPMVPNTGRSDDYIAMPLQPEEAQLLKKSKSGMRSRPKEWSVVESLTYEFCIGAVVLLNCIMIGVQTDQAARAWDANSSQTWFLFDVTFAVVFSCEILFRMWVYGRHFFRASKVWKWNTFDFFVVLMQIADLVVQMMGHTKHAGYNVLRYMRLLRMIRVARVLRVFKFLKHVPELRSLITSLGACLNGYFWTMVLITLFIYVYAIVLTQIVTEHKVKLSEEEREGQEILEEYYGTLVTTSLKLFQAIADGIHWSELSEPLELYCSPYMAVAWCFYMGFMVFAMLNIITSVFVESTLRFAAEDTKGHISMKLWEIFHDTDEAVITQQMFENQMDKTQMRDYLNTLELKLDENLRARFFHLLDRDGSGEVDVDELVDGCMRLTGPARAFDLAALHFEQAKHMDRVEATLAQMSDQLNSGGLKAGDGMS